MSSRRTGYHGPRRRTDDHVPWTRGDQREFEAQLAEQMEQMQALITRATNRISAILLTIGMVAFLVPVVVNVVLFIVGRGPGGG